MVNGTQAPLDLVFKSSAQGDRTTTALWDAGYTLLKEQLQAAGIGGKFILRQLDKTSWRTVKPPAIRVKQVQPEQHTLKLDIKTGESREGACAWTYLLTIPFSMDTEEFADRLRVQFDKLSTEPAPATLLESRTMPNLTPRPVPSVTAPDGQVPVITTTTAAPPPPPPAFASEPPPAFTSAPPPPPAAVPNVGTFMEGMKVAAQAAARHQKRQQAIHLESLNQAKIKEELATHETELARVQRTVDELRTELQQSEDQTLKWMSEEEQDVEARQAAELFRVIKEAENLGVFGFAPAQPAP